MAGKNRDEDGNELDVMALLHEVHGTADGARVAAVDAALRTLEVTHRKASLAMRAFEEEGNPSVRRAHNAPGAAVERTASATVPPPPTRTAPARAPLPAPETTAIWRPEQAPAARPSGLPRPASVEPTSVGPAPRAASDAHATSATPDDATHHAASASPPKAEADAEVDVYAGRGANWALREATKTQRILRPKK